MNYMRYKRSYIMLEENNQRIAQGKKAQSPVLKGFLKLETGSNKGFLRCSIQNLTKELSSNDDSAHLPETYPYQLFLVGKSNEKLLCLDMGKLNIDEQGNGGLVFRFNPLDINGKGYPLHLFSKAIVAGSQDFSIVMEGDLSATPFEVSQQAISDFFAAPDPQPQDAQPQDPQDQDSQSPQDQISQAQVPQPPDISAKENTQKVFWEHPDTPSQPSSLKNAADLKTANALKDAETTFSTDTYYREYLRNACEHMSRVTGLYEQIAPFSENPPIGNCQWWKVMNVMSLPFVNINAYPSCHDLAYKYHHFIFGVNYAQEGNITHYVFGIPGKYSKQEHPDEGKSGFNFWQPIRDAQKQTDAYGYWLLFLDAKTGEYANLNQ